MVNNAGANAFFKEFFQQLFPSNSQVFVLFQSRSLRESMKRKHYKASQCQVVDGDSAASVTDLQLPIPFPATIYALAIMIIWKCATGNIFYL